MGPPEKKVGPDPSRLGREQGPQWAWCIPLSLVGNPRWSEPGSHYDSLLSHYDGVQTECLCDKQQAHTFMAFYIVCDLGHSQRWEVTCLTRASGCVAFLRSKLRNKELGQPLASSDMRLITSVSPNPLADLSTQRCTPEHDRAHFHVDSSGGSVAPPGAGLSGENHRSRAPTLPIKKKLWQAPHYCSPGPWTQGLMTGPADGRVGDRLGAFLVT